MNWRSQLMDVRPLRSSRPFRDLWFGSSLGAVGAQLAKVAVLLQVWQLTHSPLWTGTIGLATAAPLIVFGLIGGSLADSLDRRTIVRVTTFGQLLSAGALATQAFAGNRSVVLLLCLVATLSTCGALGAAARRTLPVRLLPRDQLAAGLALQNMAFQAAMLLGPALAGLVIAQWGFTAAYALQALTSTAALLATLRLPPVPPMPTSEQDQEQGEGRDQQSDQDQESGREPGGDSAPPGTTPVKAKRVRVKPARGGWGIIFRRPVLWGSFATDLAATLLAMPVSLFPLVNEIRFNGDPQTLGLFLSAVAVGGLGAGLLSGSFTRLRRNGLVQLIAAGVWGLALAGFGLAGPLWLALACLTVAGAADTVSVVTRSALVQLRTPDKYRGRVSSVDDIIGVAGPEIGNFRAGAVASLTSAPFALASGGLATAAVVVLIGVTNHPLRTARNENATENATGPEIVPETETEAARVSSAAETTPSTTTP